MFRKSATRKSAPATRNLNVAVETGVNPSPSSRLTTTKELPQKVIKHNIRKALKGLIARTVMPTKTDNLAYKALTRKVGRTGLEPATFGS